MSYKMPFEKTTKYVLASSSIAYDDIPKIMNKHE